MSSKLFFYKILSVFSLILAGHWCFFSLIAAKTGGQIVIGANNMSTASGANDTARQQATEVMNNFLAYFAKFSPLQYNWTIGPAHYIPMYLCIFFLILSGIFFILSLTTKQEK